MENIMDHAERIRVIREIEHHIHQLKLNVDLLENGTDFGKKEVGLIKIKVQEADMWFDKYRYSQD